MTEWLYLQIFHEPPDADALLCDGIRPVVDEMLERSAIDRFFFLRYAEGGQHIRLRLRPTRAGERDALEASVRAALEERSSRSGWNALRIERAEYEPERVKHGGPGGQEVAERQFFASSRFAFDCLRATRERPEQRSFVAAWALHAVFECAGFQPAELPGRALDYGRHWADLCLGLAPAPEPSVPMHTRDDADPVEPSAVQALRTGLKNTEPSFLALGEGAWAAAQRWQRELRADLAELAAIGRAGLLASPRLPILWNLIHTFDNRLGLNPLHEANLARLVAAARRSETPTDPFDALWAGAERALAGEGAALWACEGDSATWLERWRGFASRRGLRWLDVQDSSTIPGAFVGQLSLGDADLDAELAARSLAVAASFLSPECPLLPDSTALYRATLEVLRQRVFCNGPCVLVFHSLDEASVDALERLDWLARSLTTEPVILLFLASGAGENVGRWCGVRDALVHDRGLGVWGELAARLPASARALRRDESSVQRGLASCRAGCLHDGARVLAEALRGQEPPSPTEQGPASSRRIEAVTCLAMAMLQTQRPSLAARLVSSALASDSAPERRRARRVAIAALHSLDDRDRLAELARSARLDLAQQDANSEVAAWLRQDIAMASALTDPALHERLLDEILAGAGRTATPSQCLAVAHIWRAAAHFVADRLESTALHQERGLRLLVSLGDDTRALFVRARFAGTLLALERWSLAAAEFEHVARQAVQTARLSLAESSYAHAVVAWVRAGDVPRARATLAHSAAHCRGLWRSHSGDLYARLAHVVVALDGDLAGVERTLAQLSEEALAAQLIPLAAEAALLLSCLAYRRGDPDTAAAWGMRAQGLLTRAPREEQPRLRALAKAGPPNALSATLEETRNPRPTLTA